LQRIEIKEIEELKLVGFGFYVLLMQFTKRVENFHSK